MDRKCYSTKNNSKKDINIKNNLNVGIEIDFEKKFKERNIQEYNQ